MDYTVGSLADLISGKSTSNKPSIKRIELKNQQKLKTTVGRKNKKRKANDNDNTVADNEEDSSVTPGESSVDIPKVNFIKKKKSSEKSVLKKKKIGNKKQNKPVLINGNTLADSEEISVTTDIKNETDAEDSNVSVIKKKIKIEPSPEEKARTIFVGNVPIKSQKKHIKRYFKQYGEIESLRFRGIPVADPKIPKKVAAIKKKFHPDRNSLYCFIRFVNKEDAEKALNENGSVFEGHHLRVHLCSAKEIRDESKAIFIGNLSFQAEEEELWKLFEPCGPISSVRIVRDSHTGMGKGFGYINFKDFDAVQLALEMESIKLGNRELRIKLSSVKTAKKNKKKENSVNATKRKNWKQNKNAQDQNGDNKMQQKQQPNEFHKRFQGSKFTNNKKKFKVNKGALDKTRKMKKIAPISKTSSV